MKNKIKCLIVSVSLLVEYPVMAQPLQHNDFTTNAGLSTNMFINSTNGNGTNTVFWANGILSVNTRLRRLIDNTSSTTLDWQNLVLNGNWTNNGTFGAASFIGNGSGLTGIGPFQPSSPNLTNFSSLSTNAFIGSSSGNGTNVSLSGTIHIKNGASLQFDTGSLGIFNLGGNVRYNPNNGILSDGSTQSSINSFNRQLIDSSGATVSVAWDGRVLLDNVASTSVDWQNRSLFDSTSGQSMSWNSRLLINGSSANVLDWGNLLLMDSGSNNSLDWQNRIMSDSTGAQSINYSTRQLNNNAAAVTLDWQNLILNGNWTNNGTLGATAFAGNGSKLTSLPYRAGTNNVPSLQTSITNTFSSAFANTNYSFTYSFYGGMVSVPIVSSVNKHTTNVIMTLSAGVNGSGFIDWQAWPNQ